MKDFFDEILVGLKDSMSKYKKSNDEKYLTEIKNITGNSLSDKELLSLGLKDEFSFSEEIKGLFQKNKMKEYQF